MFLYYIKHYMTPKQQKEFEARKKAMQQLAAAKAAEKAENPNDLIMNKIREKAEKADEVNNDQPKIDKLTREEIEYEKNRHTDDGINNIEYMKQTEEEKEEENINAGGMKKTKKRKSSKKKTKKRKGKRKSGKKK